LQKYSLLQARTARGRKLPSISFHRSLISCWQIAARSNHQAPLFWAGILGISRPMLHVSLNELFLALITIFKIACQFYFFQPDENPSLP